MADVNKASSDEIKAFAIAGNFKAVESSYGTKRLGKALNYAFEKLLTLIGKLKSEEDCSSLKFATPFLLHVASSKPSSTEADLLELGLRFNEETKQTPSQTSIKTVVTQACSLDFSNELVVPEGSTLPNQSPSQTNIREIVLEESPHQLHNENDAAAEEVLTDEEVPPLSAALESPKEFGADYRFEHLAGTEGGTSDETRMLAAGTTSLLPKAKPFHVQVGHKRKTNPPSKTSSPKPTETSKLRKHSHKTTKGADVPAESDKVKAKPCTNGGAAPVTKRDPSAPKKPQGAYMLFAHTVRDEILQGNPSIQH